MISTNYLLGGKLDAKPATGNRGIFMEPILKGIISYATKNQNIPAAVDRMSAELDSVSTSTILVNWYDISIYNGIEEIKNDAHSLKNTNDLTERLNNLIFKK